MKKTAVLMLSLISAAAAIAQESQTEYDFLRLPVSAHAAALGGDNVSLTDDDLSLTTGNPALLDNVSDKTLFLSYMNYMQGVNMGAAAFNKTYSDNLTFAGSIEFINYGSMKQTDENNVQTGTFSASDFAVAAHMAGRLARNVSGGLTARFIYSHLGSYNSMGACADLGITYINDDKGFSAGAAVRNLGGQIKAYDDNFEKMPLDIQVGATKQFEHMPLRVSLTFADLNHWDYSFINHAVVGADLLLNNGIWIGAGYNLRRAHDMKVSGDAGSKGSSHGAGLSLGAGISLQRFSLDLSWAKYHVSSNSLMLNLAYTL